MSKLKILYITTGLNIGGAELLLYHLLAHTDRERFAPNVISLAGRGPVAGQIEDLDVPVYSLDLPAGRPTARGLTRLARLVRTIRPDLVQGWMYHGNLACLAGAALAGRRVPAIWCIHKSGSSFHGEKPATVAVIRLGAALSRLPARIVYVSEVGRTRHEAMGYKADKSLVIANGINTELFRPSPAARGAIRAELGLPPDTPVIGLVARFHPQKDHGNFLRAAALLARTHPQVHFVLAGTGVVASNTALWSLVRELGLEERVHLLGERTDMPRLTAALDLATSSSVTEGLSLALVEAMAAGVPCVVTDVGDSPALVGDTGRIVPPRDAAGLAGAWAELLAAGPEVRRAMGAAARERAIARYGVGATARRYAELYEALASKPFAGAEVPSEARSA